MKYLLFIFSPFIALTIKGQGGVVTAPILETMYSTEMGLKAEDRISDQAKHVQKMAEFTRQTAEAIKQVEKTEEHLSIVKEKTEKLRKINTKISNIRGLEDALQQEAYMIKRAYDFMEEVNKREILPLQVSSDALSILSGILSSASYTIRMLTIVLTPDESEMNDYERMNLMRTFLEDLNNDIVLFETAIYEIQRTEHLIVNSRTVDYMEAYFKQTKD